ncbi:MAG: hypothetical protein K5682_09675 [Lachnospiraceae bacterium]|nr:hypothetical protein [Lachnospiraceae bacterium]
MQINLFIRHHDLREHWVIKKNSKNPNKAFFRISYEDRHAGLFGIVDRVLGACMYAEEKKLIPVVDLQEKDIQYKKREDSNTPWEVFFKPVAGISCSELPFCHKTLYMGYNSSCPRFIRDEIFDDPEAIRQAYRLYQKYIQLSDESVRRLDLERVRLDLNRSLGVFLRGTDYAALKPSKHSIQPTVEQAIPKIREYLELHPDTEYIYLVTEDLQIYETMKATFGEKVVVTGNRFIEGYDGNGLIADYISDVNEQGFEYLVRIYMLASCRALIGGPAAGASFARVINGGQYEYVHIFDLGRYE